MVLSYTIKSNYHVVNPRPTTLNSILIMLRAWHAENGRLGATDEDLFTEALERLEFLQERHNQKP